MLTVPSTLDTGAVLASALRSIARRPRPLPLGRVVVATDACLASDAAVRCAAALATARGAEPTVITVVDPVPPLSTALDPLAASAAAEVYLLEPREERLEHVRRQLAGVSASAARWPVELTHGTPAGLIAEAATRQQARLVIMGLRPHSALERVFRDETTLRVMRRATAPVLAVTPALKELPRRIAVGVDFSRASKRAAAAAIPLLADGGTLSLVHVQPRADFAARERTEGFGVIYVQGVAAAFERLQAELPVPPDVKVETVYLEGDPAEQLLAFAARSGAGLIAVGSQRHSPAGRMILGGVTTSLVRAAWCSLLVTPPAAGRD
jgi:nucleotide-binding universal stress UspA family protein